MSEKTNQISLGYKLVGDISGEFVIPDYQRGYRWGKMQIETLLNDIIDNGNEPYCLQPLVVRKIDEKKYELIDGQQRLTTIYLLLYYIKKEYKPKLQIKYSLSYKTKEEYNILDCLEEKKAYDNIDSYFIYNAFITIDNWFKKMGDNKDQSAADQFIIYFSPNINNCNMGGNVRFIWYEVSDMKDDKEAISLFTRLNIGRIPLNNAELIKALLLCRKEKTEKASEEQLKIALQWDNIERELHDDDFWNFLTKEKVESYFSRIELIFKFMVPKNERTTDKYNTFFYFNNHRSKLKELWQKKFIPFYYRLKEWYKKDNFYHKIGYLVASSFFTIDEIVEGIDGKKKSEIDSFLDTKIKESISFKTKYNELRYDKNYNEINRILLLFNVVSIMEKKGVMRFPFKFYNNEEWSLEHIHPQHPEKMKQDKNIWCDWIKSHIPSIKAVANIKNKKEDNELVKSMEEFIEKKENVTMDSFNNLIARINKTLLDTDEDLTHSLSNMALLAKNQNSALNNSLFDVKRKKIIEMDKDGQYIPYCTKMVFFKYYTENLNNENIYIWSQADRESYIKKMNKVLVNYLPSENGELTI